MPRPNLWSPRTPVGRNGRRGACRRARTTRRARRACAAEVGRVPRRLLPRPRPVLGQPLELLEAVVQPPAELAGDLSEVGVRRDAPSARRTGRRPAGRGSGRASGTARPAPASAAQSRWPPQTLHRHQRRAGLAGQGHRAGHQRADDVRRRDAALGEDADDLALAEQPPGLQVRRRRAPAGRPGCAASGPSPSRPGVSQISWRHMNRTSRSCRRCASSACWTNRKSGNETWLLASTTGPVAGTCSCPSDRTVRPSARSSAPAARR